LVNSPIGIWCLGGDRLQRDQLIAFVDSLSKAFPNRSFHVAGSWRDRARFRALWNNPNLKFASVPGSVWWTLRGKLDSYWKKTDALHAARMGRVFRVPAKLDSKFTWSAKPDGLWFLPFSFLVALILWVAMLLVSILLAVAHALQSLSGVCAFGLRRFDDDYILNCARKFLSSSACQVWIIPELGMKFPWGFPVRHVLFLDGEPWRQTPGPFDEQHIELLRQAIPGEPSPCGLFVIRNPESRPWLRHHQGSGALTDKLRWLPQLLESDQTVLPRTLLSVVDELASLPVTPEEWLRRLQARGNEPGVLHIHLFLPQAFRGGVWEALITLLGGLIQRMESRKGGKTIRLSLSLPMGQTGLEQLADFARVGKVEHYSNQVFGAGEGNGLLSLAQQRGGTVPEGERWAVLASPEAIQADVWFALADRFAFPLLPVKPLGVIVYDVIQKYLPELFPKEFFQDFQPGMFATMAVVDKVITTSEVTRADVMGLYHLPEKRVDLVPVACEPRLRFEHVVPEPVKVPDGFILNITNPTPHKGLEVMMRAYAILKRFNDKAPPLVICGSFTEKILPIPGKPEPNPVFRRLQDLIAELNLQVGVDFFVLGLVSEGQLHDLLRRSSIVVNAARFDNGTYSLIEGHYFGKHLISSDYPAARWLYDRFEVPTEYFALLDSEDLARKLAQALEKPQLGPVETERNRASLSDPKHGYARYADQVYDCLLDLGTKTGGS